MMGRTAPAVRYRADLSVLPSGHWNLSARPWAYPMGRFYSDEPGCFSFETSGSSFGTALRESFDAFTAWVRRDKNAPFCGLPRKF